MTLEDLSPIAVVLGYVISVFGGDLAIRPIRSVMYRGFEEHKTPHYWRPQIVGWLERFLYTSSILAEFPEFIAIWLALKVAGQWERWKLDIGDRATRGTDHARAAYTVYLVGNGLSILYGGLGAVIVSSFSISNWQPYVVIVGSIVVLNAALYLYIRRVVTAQDTSKDKTKISAS